VQGIREVLNHALRYEDPKVCKVSLESTLNHSDSWDFISYIIEIAYPNQLFPGEMKRV
jgi:hypothetical protein